MVTHRGIRKSKLFERLDFESRTSFRFDGGLGRVPGHRRDGPREGASAPEGIPYDYVMQPGNDSGLALGPFFHQELESGKRDLGVSVPAHAEVYAVQLLVRFATLEVDVALDRPLALQWADALEVGPRDERRRRFLRLGDAALLRNGFLHEPEDQRVSYGYIGRVGQHAFIEVARLSSRAASAAFDAIAASFETLCRLMLEIRLRYAKWDPGKLALTPDSPAVLRRFEEEGLILMPRATA